MNGLEKLATLRANTDYGDVDTAMVIYDLCLELDWCLPYHGQVHQLPSHDAWQSYSMTTTDSIFIRNSHSIAKSRESLMTWQSSSRYVWSYSKSNKSESQYHGCQASASASKSSLYSYINTSKPGWGG